jgi:tetratricopeptide (TPR) repeat protein
LIYAYGDSLTCRLPVSLSGLGIGVWKKRKRSKYLIKLLLVIGLLLNLGSTSVQAETEVKETAPKTPDRVLKYSETDLLDRPLVERYILDELKALRQDQQDLERRMVVEITDRELSVADKSMNYANVTVTYFFYIIAGVASLIAVFGWKSIREVKNNSRELATKSLNKISQEYERKFLALERELKRKTHSITDNNRQIEIINEIHNLWLRAQSVQTPEQRVQVYDEILKIRPGDLEALTYKADAVMEMKEYHWAMSLCNRVLELDESNGPALYQRACAYSRLGAEEQAIEDLARSIELSPSLKDLIAEEADFEVLHGNPKFEVLMDSHN